MSPLKCFLRAIAFVRPCTWTCTFFRFCIYRCTCQGDNLKIKVIITNENDMFNSCQMGFVSGAYIRASAAGISLTRSLVIAWSFHLAVYLCLTKLKQLWVFVLQNFLICAKSASVHSYWQVMAIWPTQSEIIALVCIIHHVWQMLLSFMYFDSNYICCKQISEVAHCFWSTS